MVRFSKKNRDWANRQIGWGLIEKGDRSPAHRWPLVDRPNAAMMGTPQVYNHGAPLYPLLAANAASMKSPRVRGGKQGFFKPTSGQVLLPSPPLANLRINQQTYLQALTVLVEAIMLLRIEKVRLSRPLTGPGSCLLNLTELHLFRRCNCERLRPPVARSPEVSVLFPQCLLSSLFLGRDLQVRRCFLQDAFVFQVSLFHRFAGIGHEASG